MDHLMKCAHACPPSFSSFYVQKFRQLSIQLNSIISLKTAKLYCDKCSTLFNSSNQTTRTIHLKKKSFSKPSHYANMIESTCHTWSFKNVKNGLLFSQKKSFQESKKDKMMMEKSKDVASKVSIGKSTSKSKSKRKNELQELLERSKLKKSKSCQGEFKLTDFLNDL